MGKESIRQGQTGCAEHWSGNTFSTKLAATFRENGRKEEEKHGTPEEKTLKVREPALGLSVQSS